MVARHSVTVVGFVSISVAIAAITDTEKLSGAALAVLVGALSLLGQVSFFPKDRFVKTACQDMEAMQHYDTEWWYFMVATRKNYHVFTLQRRQSPWDPLAADSTNRTLHVRYEKFFIEEPRMLHVAESANLKEPWGHCAEGAPPADNSSLVLGAAGRASLHRNRIQIDVSSDFAVKANLTFDRKVSMGQPLALALEGLMPISKFPMRWYVHGARVKFQGTFSVDGERHEGEWDGYADRNYGVWQQRPDRPGIAGWIWVTALSLGCSSSYCKSDALSLVVGGTLLGKLTFAFLNDEAGRFQDITWISNAVRRRHNATHSNLRVLYYSVFYRADVLISFPLALNVKRHNNPLVAVNAAVNIKVALSSILGSWSGPPEMYETPTGKIELDTSVYL